MKQWLEGFLEGKESLDKSDIEKIQKKLSEYVEPAPYYIPWQPPVYPTIPWYITSDGTWRADPNGTQITTTYGATPSTTTFSGEYYAS